MRPSNNVFRATRLLGLAFVLAGTLSVTIVSGQDNAGEQAAVRDFNTSAALQNSGFYSRAGQRWQAFLKKYPQDSRLDRVYYYLGTCQLHEKKYSEAIGSFQVVLGKFANSKVADASQYNLGMTRFQLAQDSKKPADFQAAATDFEAVVTKHAKSRYVPKALYFRGESLYLAGNVKGAVDAYQRLVNSHPQDPLVADALYALGTAQQEREQPQEAAKAFQAFLARPALGEHELANEVRLRLGLAHFEAKQFSAAEKLFQQLSTKKDFPLADLALLRQAQCRQESGQLDQAAQLYDDLIKRFPKSNYVSAARLAAGKARFRMQKYADARKLFEPVAKTDQAETAEATYWLGRTLLKLKQPSAALAVLEPATKRIKGEFAPYLQAARIDALYELPQRRKETAALYQEFAKQHPQHPLAAEAHYMSALVHLEENRYPAARQQAESFLSNKPYSGHRLTPAVLFIAAESHLLGAQREEQGADRQRAEALYRRLVQEHAEHGHAARARLRIGWCLLLSEKHAEVVPFLQAALAKLGAPAEKAEAHLLIGRSHSATGRQQDAAASFDAALAADPKWNRRDEVLLAAAQARRELEDMPGAGQKLKQLIDGNPDSPWRALAYFEAGEVAYAQNKLDDAIGRYREVTQKFSQSEWAAPASYGLALAQFAKQDYKSVVTTLGDLLSKYPQSDAAPRGRYLRGLAFQRQDQFKQAIDDFAAFVALKSPADDRYDARYAMALCQIGLKDHDSACATLSALVQEKPDYAQADRVYYELGHALQAQKKQSEASEAFRTLATKIPNSPLVPECWFHVGTFHEQQSSELKESAKVAELDKAADAYRAGLTSAADADLNEKLRYKLGDVQFRQEKYEQAAVTLLEQIKAHSKGALVGPARFLAAESLFRNQQFDRARPLFDQVIKDKVETYGQQALFRAAICAENLKDWPAAQQRYSQLISQYPKSDRVPESRYGLGWALQNQNKLSEARKVYEQIGTQRGTETEAKALFMLGEIAFGEKDFTTAIEQFLTVTASYPYKQWQALARFETGRCFVELDDPSRAREAFQDVVDKHADHPKAKDAAKLIAELKN